MVSEKMKAENKDHTPLHNKITELQALMDHSR